ncbi:MAG: AI-2E family transporter [Lachnospiraceae bacterium]|nr:AI-2E family transporter [Lachnospiraceae bacterium]
MKKWEEYMEKRWLSNLFTVCIGILLYMGIKNFHSVAAFFSEIYRIVAPLLIGFIFAYLIDPIAGFCDQKILKKVKNEKNRWLGAVILAVIFVLTLITLFFVALIPSITSCIKAIFTNKDTYIRNIDNMIQSINSWHLGIHLDMPALTAYLESILNTGFEYMTDNMGQVINLSKNVGSAFINTLLGFILCIYFLAGKRHLLAGLEEFRSAALTEEQYQTPTDFGLRCHKIFIQYLGYDLVDGLIVGTVNAIIMLILGMPYVALISVIVGITNLLPTFGPVIGLIIGGLLLVMVNPVYALWFLIMVIVIQTIDGYILKPKMFGGALGIPPVWTLIAIVIGGKLFGALGILLAIPFAAVINFLYKENFLPWLQKRKKQK